MKIKNEFWETILGYFGQLEPGCAFDLRNQETSSEAFLKIKEITSDKNSEQKHTYNCVNLRTGKLCYFHDTQELFVCLNAEINLRPGFWWR